MLAAIAAVTTKLKIGSAVYHILGRDARDLGASGGWFGQSFRADLRFIARSASAHRDPTVAAMAAWPEVLDRPIGRARGISKSRAPHCAAKSSIFSEANDILPR